MSLLVCSELSPQIDIFLRTYINLDFRASGREYVL